MEQIEDKTPINANAKYIILNVKGNKMYVDMYDILDIVPSQMQMLNEDKTGYIDLKNVVFKDGLVWTLAIDDKTLKLYEKFKNKLDKEK